MTWRSKGQGHRVMKCAVGMGVHVSVTAQVSSYHVCADGMRVQAGTCPVCRQNVIGSDLTAAADDSIGNDIDDGDNH